ncbi:hypothetical protein [Dyella sp. Tek66A03]|uniref:hypothetical protein n=1 Tax=Dyella sp. Tek66A03 TaxID=3458298 RepID=UPI00403EB9E8
MPMIRSISLEEASVVERTVQVGAVRAVSPEMMASVGQLKVTASCKCGCATVWFGPDGDAAAGTKVAEACGTWNGQTIDIIVWAVDDQIVGLEVAGAGSVGLPASASVRRYEEYFHAPG